MTHQGAACDVPGVHFGRTIRRTDTLVYPCCFVRGIVFNLVQGGAESPGNWKLWVNKVALYCCP